MIISVEEAKVLIDYGDWTDRRIERKLKAIEQAVRSYTNNNFQDKDYRRTADIVGGSFYVGGLNIFETGDTIQVSESTLNKGLFTVTDTEDSCFRVKESLKDENGVLVTKVVYPDDVVDCAIKMLEWEINHSDKVGIQSETLSRRSVTYFNMEGDNSINGYPKSLFGALKPYRKCRC